MQNKFTPSLCSIYHWIESFETGGKNIIKDSRSGRPNKVVNPKKKYILQKLRILLTKTMLSIRTLEEEADVFYGENSYITQ